MNKPTRSWMVPVSTFALALVLAIVAGPKKNLFARPPAGATPATGCVCDVYNLFGVTLVGPKRAIGSVDYDFWHGHPSMKTYSTVGNTCLITLSYQVDTPLGGRVTRTKDVAMNNKPKFWDETLAVGVNDTKKISALFDLNIKDLDKAMKSTAHAIAKSGSGETFVGETATSRNPMIFKFKFHGITKMLPSGATCTDDLNHTVPTPIDAAGHGDAIVEKAN